MLYKGSIPLSLSLVLITACGGGGNNDTNQATNNNSSTQQTAEQPATEQPTTEQPTAIKHSVITSVFGNGTITPESSSVEHGGSISFELSTDGDNILYLVEGCGGELNGTTYQINSVEDDCAITVTYLGNPFVTKWNAVAGQPIEFKRAKAFAYDYVIDWGDDSALETEEGSASHIYKTSGEVFIKIYGKLPAVEMCSIDSESMLLDVVQWGQNEWLSMEKMFASCLALESFSAEDVPNLSQVSSMSNMFNSAPLFNGNVADWNVSNVKNMAWMFAGVTTFSNDLSSWDVSSVEDMSHMFTWAWQFNGDISMWDVKNVTNMESMFYGAALFDKDLSRWDVSNVSSYQDFATDSNMSQEPDWPKL